MQLKENSLDMHLNKK